MAWENTRYLGIELEVECQGDRQTMAKRLKQWLEQQPKTADLKTKEGRIIPGKSLDKLVYMKNPVVASAAP
jgi:hypothetical protein